MVCQSTSFWVYESCLQKKTTKILRWLDAGEKMLTELEMVSNIYEKLCYLFREPFLFQSTCIYLKILNECENVIKNIFKNLSKNVIKNVIKINFF